MLPKPSPPAAAQVADDVERARRELAKLGVVWDERLDDKVYRLLIELPPQLGRPVRRVDLVEKLDAINGKTISDALARLRDAGRVLHLRELAVWVAVVADSAIED